MGNRRFVILATAVVSLAAFSGVHLAQKPVVPAAPAVAAGMPIDAQQALTKQYCSGCHNPKLKSGNMSLADLDLAHPEKSPELAERVIRKLRVGLMPPVGSARPAADTMKLFVTTLESEMDREATLHPNPGKRGFQRLTR